MKFEYDDGGRAAAGYKGAAGDCVARAIAIASGRAYTDVYDSLADGMGSQRRSRGRTARNGVTTNRKWFRDYMSSLGFRFVPTMGIGTGCRVHLRDGELPMGRLVVSVSRHYVAVVNGVVRDTHDPSRDGTRCVYGYWIGNG